MSPADFLPVFKPKQNQKKNQQTPTTGPLQIEELRAEMAKRDQELLATGAKMKTLEEQHQDYQRHIAVLKESLCAKEDHYNMLRSDVRHQVQDFLFFFVLF